GDLAGKGSPYCASGCSVPSDRRCAVNRRCSLPLVVRLSLRGGTKTIVFTARECVVKRLERIDAATCSALSSAFDGSSATIAIWVWAPVSIPTATQLSADNRAWLAAAVSSRSWHA